MAVPLTVLGMTYFTHGWTGLRRVSYDLCQCVRLEKKGKETGGTATEGGEISGKPK